MFYFNFSGYSQTEGYAVSTDNTPVHYKVFGNGEPLLIINGGPGMNCNGFEGLAVKLSSTNKTIIYDQRGTGESKLPKLDSTTLTMKLMIDDIETLRKYLHIEKWIVLGHSFGGMVASYYATLFPDHIEKIILSSSGGIDLGLLGYISANINAKLSKEEAQAVSYWSQQISNGDTSYHAKIQRGMNLAPAYVYDRKWVPVIAERLTQGNSRINQLLWDDLRKIKFNCFYQLRSFAKPVLIIQGKQDIVNPQTAELSHKAFKNSRIVFIDHCIHYGWLDNETDYFKARGTVDELDTKIRHLEALHFNRIPLDTIIPLRDCTHFSIIAQHFKIPQQELILFIQILQELIIQLSDTLL